MATRKKVASETVTDVPKVVTKAPAMPKGRVVYVGPTLLRLGLTKGTVFIDGMPAIAKDVMSEHPLITSLFVPVSGLSQALEQVEMRGSALWVAANDVKEVK